MTADGFWWTTAASEWFDYDDGAGRHHDYIADGVEVSCLEVVAPDGTREVAGRMLDVEVLWRFELGNPADQAQCIAALRETADLLELIGKRGGDAS